MSASEKPPVKPFRFRVLNPELDRPRRVPPEESALVRARLGVCRKCPKDLYQFKRGRHCCLSIGRQCERLDLRNPAETCPIGAWDSQNPGVTGG